MRRVVWFPTLVAAVTGLVAGCSGSSGAPAGGGASKPPGSPATSSSAAPNRPKDIPLSGVDPCGLVPQDKWPPFSITQQGDSQTNETFQSPECFYSTDVGAFRVTLVTTKGIGIWTDGSQQGQGKPGQPVAGFPSVVIDGVAPHRCDVAVDTANGQQLLAAVIVTPGQEAQLPPRCDAAHQLAETAMNTLTATH